jgi:hypothetical protein
VSDFGKQESEVCQKAPPDFRRKEPKKKMKKYILLAGLAGILVGCEAEVTTPAGEKDTTIINTPGEKKTETSTTVTPGGSSSTTTTEKK